jgi:hypothetical protein
MALYGMVYIVHILHLLSNITHYTYESTQIYTDNKNGNNIDEYNIFVKNIVILVTCIYPITNMDTFVILCILHIIVFIVLCALQTIDMEYKCF